MSRLLIKIFISNIKLLICTNDKIISFSYSLVISIKSTPSAEANATKDIKKKYNRGYLKDEQDNPVEALIYIEDSQTGERLFTTKSSVSGQFAYPKQTKKANLISVIKGYVPKYNPDTIMVKASDPKAHLIEHGHDVKVRKDGRVLGHAPAFPFMGPAEDAVRERLPEIINSVVGALTIEVKS